MILAGWKSYLFLHSIMTSSKLHYFNQPYLPLSSLPFDDRIDKEPTEDKVFKLFISTKAAVTTEFLCIFEYDAVLCLKSFWLTALYVHALFQFVEKQ